MKKREISRLKDHILRLVANHEVQTVSDLEHKLQRDYSVVAWMTEQLWDEGMIELREISPNQRKGRDYLISRISSKGAFFLHEQGGYEALFRQQQRKRAWEIVKPIAGVLNALAIVGISIWAIIRAGSSTDGSGQTNKSVQTESVTEIQTSPISQDSVPVPLK